MYHEEGELLQQVIENGLPCELVLPTYNEALSLHARLNKYLRNLRKVYSDAEVPNAFESVDVIMLKPTTLRFQPRNKPKLRPVGEGQGQEAQLLDILPLRGPKLDP